LEAAVKRDFYGRSNAKAWTVAAVTAALFVPLGVFGAPALARSAASASQYEYAGSQYQYKVTLCHHTHSKTHPWVQIRVGAPAATAHLKHHDGDYLGPCRPAAPVTVATGQGNSGDHGKSGDHGNSGGHGKGHGK
jgi:hypothetical protein